MNSAARPLGELANIVSGFAFSSEHFNDSGLGLPLVRIRDVLSGQSETYYSGQYRDDFIVNDGDALIGMDGEFNLGLWRGGRALLNQRVCKVQSIIDHLDQGYLLRFLRLALKRIEEKTPFVTVKHLSVKELREVLVPLPSFAEQRRIAEILDKADALRAKRCESIAKLDHLLQSAFFEMFGGPDVSDFPIVELNDVCDRITDGAHFTPTYVDEGVPFLRVTDVQSKKIDWNSTKKIPIAEHQELRKRCDPERGDVLYSKNGTIGIPKLVDWDDDFSIFVSLALLKPNRSKLRGEFLESFLRTPFALKQAIGRSKTGTVTNLHLVEIRQVKMPLPSLDLQDQWIRFRELVSKRRNLIDFSLVNIERLIESLQQQAFSGVR